MNSHSVIGYLLLTLGLLLIIFSLWQSYGIFTGQQQAPEVFKLPPASQSPSSNTSSPSAQDFQQQINAQISQQFTQLLPVRTVTQMFNMFIWLLLATLLIFGGGQMAGLGIKLLK